MADVKADADSVVAHYRAALSQKELEVAILTAQLVDAKAQIDKLTAVAQVPETPHEITPSPE